MLALVSVAVAALAVGRLTGAIDQEVDPAWWVFLVIAFVLAIDLSRTVVSARTARRYQSEALRSNALHFGSDFAGTLAVLGGLIAASAGFPAGDSIAALFVAALVLAAAGRLIRRNVDVLMDRAPADVEAAARAAIAEDRAAGRAVPPPAASVGGSYVRGRRHLRLAWSRRRPGPRRWRTGSRRRSSGRCPAATSSSMSSPAGRTPRSASARTRRR